MDPKTAFFTGVFLMSFTAVGGMDILPVPEYHFINIPKTWHEAQNYCRVNYDDLARVDGMADQQLLAEILGNAGVESIWIGLERVETEWWVWSDGIGEVDVYAWNIPKEHGDCTEMSLMRYWYGKQCDTLKAFLCFEYDVTGTEVYFLHTGLKTWRDAQTYCRQNHHDLVSVKTDLQNSDVFAAASGHVIWLGLSREPWRWSDRGSRSFRYWHGDEPNNLGGNEDCVLAAASPDYMWADRACHLAYPFVCRGEHKRKRAVVKVKISSEVNLNMPTLSDSLLQQFQALLEEQGLTEIKVRWHTPKDEYIFERAHVDDNGDQSQPAEIEC